MAETDPTETPEGGTIDGLNPARLEAANTAVEKLADAYPALAMLNLQEIRATFALGRSGDSKEIKEALHRFAHNLIGQGALFRYPLISEIAQSMYGHLREHDRSRDLRCVTIEAYFDAIEEVFDRKLVGDCGPEGDAILTRLEALAA